MAELTLIYYKGYSQYIQISKTMRKISEMVLDDTLDVITEGYIDEPYDYPQTHIKDSAYIRKGKRAKQNSKPKVRKMRNKYYVE